MTRTLVLLASLAAAPLAAQSAVVGAWKLTYPGGVRVNNGVTTVTQATGLLTISAKGDSLFGSLVADSTPGQATRPPLPMAGTIQGEQGVLKSESKVTMRINGEDSQATAVATWTFKASGDNLEGFVERHLQGEPSSGQGAQLVVGKRLKK